MGGGHGSILDLEFVAICATLTRLLWPPDRVIGNPQNMPIPQATMPINRDSGPRAEVLEGGILLHSVTPL